MKCRISAASVLLVWSAVSVVTKTLFYVIDTTFPISVLLSVQQYNFERVPFLLPVPLWFSSSKRLSFILILSSSHSIHRNVIDRPRLMIVAFLFPLRLCGFSRMHIGAWLMPLHYPCLSQMVYKRKFFHTVDFAHKFVS